MHSCLVLKYVLQNCYNSHFGIADKKIIWYVLINTGALSLYYDLVLFVKNAQQRKAITIQLA